MGDWKIEGVPVTCGREETRRFGSAEYRPMKPLPTDSEAQAFAKRVRAGKLAWPFDAPSPTKVTKEPSGYMVWMKLKDAPGNSGRNPFPRKSPRHTAFELGRTRPRLSR